MATMRTKLLTNCVPGLLIPTEVNHLIIYIQLQSTSPLLINWNSGGMPSCMVSSPKLLSDDNILLIFLFKKVKQANANPEKQTDVGFLHRRTF